MIFTWPVRKKKQKQKKVKKNLSISALFINSCVVKEQWHVMWSKSWYDLHVEQILKCANNK